MSDVNIVVQDLVTAVAVVEDVTYVNLTFPGPQGPPGPPGPTGGESFMFTQSVASSSWVITHNLGRHPNVILTEIDGVAGRYQADYVDNSVNQLTVSFLAPHTGKAELE